MDLLSPESVSAAFLFKVELRGQRPIVHLAAALDTLSAFEAEAADRNLQKPFDDGLIEEDRESNNDDGDGTIFGDCDQEMVNEDGLESDALS